MRWYYDISRDRSCCIVLMWTLCSKGYLCLTPTTGEYSFLVEAALPNQQSADKFACCCLLRDNGEKNPSYFCDRTSQKVLVLAIASREGADPVRPSSCGESVAASFRQLYIEDIYLDISMFRASPSRGYLYLRHRPVEWLAVAGNWTRLASVGWPSDLPRPSMLGHLDPRLSRQHLVHEL
jgi:hypothetical protein